MGEGGTAALGPGPQAGTLREGGSLGWGWRRGRGGAGVPDSRINVLKATTPSSPCRKMPKLCMSAPLSQRPAPDATVEAGPPGSPRLTFPPGPCMAAWRQRARSRLASLQPGPRRPAATRDLELGAGTSARCRPGAARNPTSRSQSLIGRARREAGFVFRGRGSGQG